MATNPTNVMINLNSFSPFPGGALRQHGDFSGEEFRQDHLTPALRAAEETASKVYVSIDGTIGLSTAFIRSAFGDLIIEDNFEYDFLKDCLVIMGNHPSFKFFEKEIWQAIEDARSLH